MQRIFIIDYGLKRTPTLHIAYGGQGGKLQVFRIFVLLVPGDSKVGVKPPQAICCAVMGYTKKRQ
jgi:hypothetical protein